MAKTSFYQNDPVVGTEVSSLVETSSSLSNTDSNAKSSFYRSNSTRYEELQATSVKSLLARFVIFSAGLSTDGELVARFLITDAISFETDLEGSLASATVAATSETIYTIKKNGDSAATITFGAGETDGVFEGSLSLVDEDVLTIHAPATADATLANVSITLAGTRTL